MISSCLTLFCFILVCICLAQYQRIRSFAHIDTIVDKLVQKSSRSIINATNTANPVVALVESSSGLRYLESAIMLTNSADETLIDAYEKFVDYQKDVQSDLCTHLPDNLKIVRSVGTDLSEWKYGKKRFSKAFVLECYTIL